MESTFDLDGYARNSREADPAQTRRALDVRVATPDAATASQRAGEPLLGPAVGEMTA